MGVLRLGPASFAVDPPLAWVQAAVVVSALVAAPIVIARRGWRGRPWRRTPAAASATARQTGEQA